MNKKFLGIIFSLLFVSIPAFADKFVPEFDKMKTLRCDISETIFSQDNSVVSQSKYFRIFHLDDENNLIYLQKSPVDGISYYGSDKISFSSQYMSDDFIMQTQATIDRLNEKYTSNSVLTYDNMAFGVRNAKASGTCKFLN